MCVFVCVFVWRGVEVAYFTLDRHLKHEQCNMHFSFSGCNRVDVRLFFKGAVTNLKLMIVLNVACFWKFGKEVIKTCRGVTLKNNTDITWNEILTWLWYSPPKFTYLPPDQGDTIYRRRTEHFKQDCNILAEKNNKWKRKFTGDKIHHHSFKYIQGLCCYSCVRP